MANLSNLIKRIESLESKLTRLEAQALSSAGVNSDWINVTSFSNSWAQFGSVSDFQVRYRKLAGGLVVVAGLADPSSATGNVVFTLPAGYRPSKNVYYAGMQSGLTSPTTYFVSSAGEITFSYVTSGWCSLNVVFLAEQ